MGRDDLGRMDVDTSWAYDRKVRKLQQLYPDRWPVYWAAYMALLAEAWKKGNRRLTLDDAWCPAVPCPLEEALAALVAAGITDAGGRVPVRSWKHWYEPAAQRIAKARDHARKAATKRWGNRKNDSNLDSDPRGGSEPPPPDQPKSGPGNGAPAMPGHSPSNARAMHHASQPRQPTKRILSEENPSRAKVDEEPDVQALLDRGWREVSEAQRDVLFELADRHDRHGDEGEWAAAIIRAVPLDEDPLQALFELDREWQIQRRAEVDAEDLEWRATKEADRRASEQRFQPITSEGGTR